MIFFLLLDDVCCSSCCCCSCCSLDGWRISNDWYQSIHFILLNQTTINNLITPFQLYIAFNDNPSSLLAVLLFLYFCFSLFLFFLSTNADQCWFVVCSNRRYLLLYLSFEQNIDQSEACCCIIFWTAQINWHGPRLWLHHFLIEELIGRSAWICILFWTDWSISRVGLMPERPIFSLFAATVSSLTDGPLFSLWVIWCSIHFPKSPSSMLLFFVPLFAISMLS